jgi:hypothetical protein
MENIKINSGTVAYCNVVQLSLGLDLDFPLDPRANKHLLVQLSFNNSQLSSSSTILIQKYLESEHPVVVHYTVKE